MTASTPIFYHPAQEVAFDFISVAKIPEFIHQLEGDVRSGFEPRRYPGDPDFRLMVESR